eukprot:TRINITY_DN1512_c0_g1_i1.p1 TRINITY_DN1512_c0_g1~~TRINITY_DN1512_c0_g1_i1.p1  ORF type:complete len:1112 (-),score=243.12 TRINITY_DN1512_c0_g1_i1:191-3526(-)
MESAVADEIRLLSLTQFEDMLLENGFDCVEAIAYLDMDDVEAMAKEKKLTVRLGEKKRLMRLKEQCKEIMDQRRRSLTGGAAGGSGSLSLLRVANAVTDQNESKRNVNESSSYRTLPPGDMLRIETDEVSFLNGLPQYASTRRIAEEDENRPMDDEELKEIPHQLPVLVNHLEDLNNDIAVVPAVEKNEVEQQPRDDDEKEYRVREVILLRPKSRFEMCEVPSPRSCSNEKPVVSKDEPLCDDADEIISLSNDEPEMQIVKDGSGASREFVNCAACSKKCCLFFAESVDHVQESRLYCGQCMKKAAGNVMFLGSESLEHFKFSRERVSELLNRPALDAGVVKKNHVGIICDGQCGSSSFIERTRFVCLKCLEEGMQVNFCFKCAALNQVHEKSHAFLAIPFPLDVFPDQIRNIPEITMCGELLTFTAVFRSKQDVSDVMAYLLRNYSSALRKEPAVFRILSDLLLNYNGEVPYQFHLDALGNSGVSILNVDASDENVIRASSAPVRIPDRAELEMLPPRVLRPIPSLVLPSNKSMPQAEIHFKSPREFYAAGGVSRSNNEEKSSVREDSREAEVDQRVSTRRLRLGQRVARSSLIKLLRTGEQRRICFEIFNKLVKRLSSGKLSDVVFFTQLGSHGLVYPERYLKSLFVQFDTDKDGYLSYSEFCLLFVILYNYAFCRVCSSIVDSKCWMCNLCPTTNAFVVCDFCYSDKNSFEHNHPLESFDQRNGFEVRNNVVRKVSFASSSLVLKNVVEDVSHGSCRLLSENVVLQGDLFQCVDCGLDEKSDNVICGFCAETCHKGHAIRPSSAEYGICDCTQSKRCCTFKDRKSIPVRCFKCNCLLDSFFTLNTPSGLELRCHSCVGDFHCRVYFPSIEALLLHPDKSHLKMKLKRQFTTRTLESAKSFVHWGIHCSGDKCGNCIIEGLRYLCLVCLESGVNVNLCRDCTAEGAHDLSHPLSVIAIPEDRLASFQDISRGLKVELLKSGATKIKVGDFGEENLLLILSYFARNFSGSHSRAVGGFFHQVWKHSKAVQKSLIGCVLEFHSGGFVLLEVQSDDKCGVVYQMDLTDGAIVVEKPLVSRMMNSVRVKLTHGTRASFKLEEIAESLSNALKI